MKAIIFNRVEPIKLLLRYGSDMTLKNNSGLSAKDLTINSKNNDLINIILVYEEVFCNYFKFLIF